MAVVVVVAAVAVVVVGVCSTQNKRNKLLFCFERRSWAYSQRVCSYFFPPLFFSAAATAAASGWVGHDGGECAVSRCQSLGHCSTFSPKVKQSDTTTVADIDQRRGSAPESSAEYG